MPINVQLNDANFSLGPVTGFFYSCSFDSQRLLRLEADGTVVQSFPVARATFRNPVKELHFDGTFFWTLEDLPSSLGIVIKKWRLSPVPTAAFPNAIPIEFRWQDELTLVNTPAVRWVSDAFATEHYHREFDGNVAQGASTFKLNTITNINVGDILYLGPSSFSGFTNNEEQITVTGLNPSTNTVSFFKVGGLENSYTSQDPVDFIKSIFVFGRHAFSGNEDDRGALVKYAYPSKAQIFSDWGRYYGVATAADFDETTLSWVSSFQILELDITNPFLNLSVSQESNLVEDDFTTLIEVFDLISDLDQNQYLKLQGKETTEDLDTGILVTEDFGGTFNFQSQPTLTFVNSTALSFGTRFSRAQASGNTINIAAEVRDQFNFPVFNKTVQFTAVINEDSDAGIPGTFSPDSGITSVSGTVLTVYTPSSTPTDIIVDVTAEVI